MKLYNKKKILITGGTGMIGRSLVSLLLKFNARITLVSLDKPINLPKEIKFIKSDLRYLDNCLKVCKGMDFVFHLAGVKGSPLMASRKPASFFVPTIMFNSNMIEAARISKVKRFLYTSSIGVYFPKKKLFEEDVWKTFPSPNDKFAGWAKRMGELQIQSYNIEYSKKNMTIVRPANVYGPHDNFDPENAMVIPSLISRMVKGENPLKVWGDGQQIRDFIHADDVARGMAIIMKKKPNYPVNLGSGKKVSIKQIIKILQKIKPDLKVKWDVSKPSGDKIRLMDISRALKLGFKTKIDIETGINQTYQWYKLNKSSSSKKYNSFKEKKSE